MFGRNRHDRLFARFASGGDVSALGEVFDATAPELLRIAAHLAGSRERASDLVQETFLIAIEKRGEFATERRVLPWLCGILVNLARNARRREQRELTHAPRAGSEDPAAAAEAAEFRAALANAKQALPDVYRPVLDLHLDHGLSAAEIGGALGRPAGTVRTQIVRGLALLRRQLPHGFVAGLAVVVPGGAVLRAMRALVMHRAAEMVPTAGAVASGAGLSLAVIGAGAMQKKLAVVGAIAVLIALGSWIAATSLGTGDEVQAIVRVAPELVVSTPMDGVRGGTAPAASPAPRGPAPIREVAPSVPAAVTGSLEVLAKWRNDDAPAHAQAITVVAADAPGKLGARSLVADAGGRAVFAALPPGAVLVQASTGVRGQAVVVAGERTTLTLALDGVVVLGQVVDHRGEAVAGADVWVSSEVVYTRARTEDEPARGQYGHHTLHTDEHGRFATRMAAKQCIAASKPGHGPSLMQFPLVGKGREPRGPIEIVLPLLPAGGTLAVAVRGKDAVPVAKALVLAGREVPTLTGEEHRATTPAQRASTDATGAVTLTALPTGRIPVQVRASGHAPWSGKVDVIAGVTTSLDVELVDGGIVIGVVLDGTGEPLADALVHHGSPSALGSSLAMTDAKGAYRLEHLPAGEIEVAAFHESWGTVSRMLPVRAGETTRWDARMPPRAAITGRVLDGDGQPVGGCYVTACEGLDGKFATTFADAAGRFTLSPLDPGHQYSVTAEVQLRSGGFAHPRRESVLAGTEIELRVTADQVPTARLRGRVLQAAGRPAVGCEVDAETVGESIGSRHPIGEDGTFELGPFHAQRVRLSVHRVGTYGAALGEFGVHEMRDGATVDVGDLVVPSTGAMRIRITGATGEGACASLFRDGRHVEQRRVGDAGEIAWDELSPGKYSVCVVRGGTAPLCGIAEIEVVPGRRAEVTVAVAPGNRREVQLGTQVPVTGSPAAPGSPEVMGAPVVVLRAIDAAGRTVMMAWTILGPDATSIVLPATAVELLAVSDDGRRGSITVASPGNEPLVIPLTRR